MTTIDVNSDLGEGFGHWTLGDDDALLGIVTSANVCLRVPRRRRLDHAPSLRAGG